MKILVPGTNQEWTLQVQCTGIGNQEEWSACGALLLIQTEDVFITKSTARDETEIFFTIKCPQCGCKTDIPEKLIPSKIKKEINDNDFLNGLK